jgi:hypothetical protein
MGGKLLGFGCLVQGWVAKSREGAVVRIRWLSPGVSGKVVRVWLLSPGMGGAKFLGFVC